MKEGRDGAVRRRIVALGGFLALGRAVPSLGQWVETGLSPEELRARKDALVASVLQLQGKESAAFWPVYREYQEELEKVERRLTDLVRDYVARYESLDDASAIRVIEESLEIDSEHVRLRRRFGSRLAKVLSARKVARYLQLENRFAAQMRAELMQTIPARP